MTTIHFFEKPGCRTNAKQKALLEASGHQVIAFDLLSQGWTHETLRPFLGQLPVVEWFNPAAPDVRSGTIRPETFDESGALAAMVADPLLIRRPLMEIAGRKFAGFDRSRLEQWIWLAPNDGGSEQGCSRTDGGACPPPTDPRLN
jgi:nitrogenase-associated protein